MTPATLGTAAAAGPGARSRAKQGRPAPRAPEHELRKAERQVIDQAVALIRQRHESGRIPDHMHYHNSEHTIGVVERAQAIGQALGMSDRQLLLTVIAAAYHDTVQRWVAMEGEGGVVTRKRLTGRDEVASAAEAAEAMAGLEIRFTPDEYGIVSSAIVGTIPGWDNEASTVCQPFLIEHPVIRAVALADLGSAGMDPVMYGRDGPALFAEENLDLMEVVMAAERVGEIPEASQQFYRARYLAWLKVQPGFARGRENRLDNGELDGLDPAAITRVRALFCRFEESVAAAEAAITAAQTLDFAPLMRQLDPRAFPAEPR
ncbi:MAG TPA: HD domain-containing protein [Allosphingosinicella sp.]|nr:HD domain-containing protein [Allosphingosinicella sp.]